MTTGEKIGQLMMDAPAIPRLGVPAYHWWNEALHGIARNGEATVFPQAIGLAATWDPALIRRVATVISTEARAKNNLDPNGIYHGLTLWSPNVNIFRDPRWGRGQETYGEDPFLTGRMGVAFVRGIQGDGPILRAVATPKHFAVHSGPEPLRHAFDAKVSERDLYETYLPAFEACVREGRAASVMCAYSGFNGVPATGNAWLLTGLLRGKWGFGGAVVSDVDSVHDLWAGHKAAKDAAEASAMALKAGDDLCSGETYRALPEALRRGLVSEGDLDRAAVRLFTLRYRLGMFDENPYRRIPASAIDSPENAAVNLQAAKESLVLLKNGGALPFGRKVRRVAVIGPTADDQDTLVGNYNGTPSKPVTILAGLRARGLDVTAARGCELAEGIDAGRGAFPPGSVTHEGKGGFRREIYRGRNFETLVRSDAAGEIEWAWNPPGHPVELPEATDVSVRWTGTFTPPESGEATFGVSADDGVRVYADDRLLVDDWREDAERSHTFRLKIARGVPVRLRVEYFQAKGGAAIRFGVSMPKGDALLNEALAAMASADAAVLTLGITPRLEGEEMSVDLPGFRGGDRTAIELPKPQRELLAAVSRAARAAGKPVVVVLTGGSALALNPDLADAVLLQWYSGGRGGEAVAAALFGDFSPSGRLPLTFYRATADLPAFGSYAMAGRTYRYFGGKPLWAFGHGLSYTRFAYGTPKVAAGREGWSLKVPVRNVGVRDGQEVVQVYARPMRAEAGDARRSLVGFARVEIPKGKGRAVTVEIPKSRLRVWGPARKDYRVRPGDYVLEIGASSVDRRGQVAVSVPR